MMDLARAEHSPFLANDNPTNDGLTTCFQVAETFCGFSKTCQYTGTHSATAACLSNSG